ncbi:MAG: apolipoprotein N-acyltransferase [Propionicimonas sp.]|nr:apolipoprotein N-acyltransferase [Propionicimonas sp.]
MIDRVARLQLGLRVGLAIGFGVVTGLGFEPFAWWPLLIPGTAGLSLLVLGAGRWWQALLLGLGYGLGFMGLGLDWMNAIFLEAYLGIVLATTFFYVLLAGLAWFVRGRAWWPPVIAACWVGVEALVSRWPFDGFGWMRLGYALVDSPLTGLYPLVGVAGVTFAIALVGQGLLWLVDRPGRARVLVAGLVTVALLGVSWAGSLIPAGTAGEPVNVGWVQGGAPGGGVYGIGPARTTTKNHLAGTVTLMDDVAAGRVPRPDFIVWPENGTDMDPYHDAQTAQALVDALQVAQVPLFAGTILDGPGPDERQTASLWLDPSRGEVTRYTKRGIVPFGEWIPYRDVLLPLIPKLGYVGAQSIPGTEPGVLQVSVAGQPLNLGVMICYDVSFDAISYDTVRYGGQVLVVQSSNAMYQGTGQIEQQFAITRARAAELRREILVVTTSGVSGLIGPDGSVTWEVTDPGAATGVVSLARRTGITPVVSIAPVLELTLAAAGGLLVLGSALWRRRAE